MPDYNMTHAEIELLHAKMDAILSMQHRQARARHVWMKHIVKDLETNPRTQYKVHLYGVVYWLANFPLIAAFFFLAPNEWLKWGVFITLQYSIYANFATDYGAMSAAMAAFGQTPLPELPISEHVEAEDGKLQMREVR